MSVQKVDILNPDIYEKGVPHETFERLRREAPVYFHEEPNGPGFWAVTKHRDVMEVSRNAAVFSSLVGGTTIEDLPKEDIRMCPDNVAVMDPPKHTQFRGIIGQAFTPTSVARMDGFIREHVSRLLDVLVERGRFELMRDFASRIPMAIILRMVGVPTEDEAMLGTWIAQILATDDPEFQVTEAERLATTRNFMEYAHRLARSRREAPKDDDLLSVLMTAQVDGRQFTYEEFGMFFMLLLAAGTHTSQLSLGNGTLALIQHPEQRLRWRRERGIAASAVEEILRMYPPLAHFRRTATQDTVIRGQAVKQGQKVVVWYVSANRDEEVFANPHAFDIGRAPNEHLSFGYGPHFCIGNALARMALRIALDACVGRMPNMELDGTPERLRSNWFNGLKRLPVATGRLE